MVASSGAKAPLIMLVALQIVPAALFLSLGHYPAAPTDRAAAEPKPVARSAA